MSLEMNVSERNNYISMVTSLRRDRRWIWRRKMRMVIHHFTMQHTMVTSLWCSTCASRVLIRR